jgi:2-amino-4-hydroxy-6-hydroxymethyldihydropteridine diphosphokinase
MPETTIVRGSSLYDTEPVGLPDQPNFLNGVVQVETHLAPRQLLWNLKLIERRMGRVRTQHWGPRVIDLDLLLYGDDVVDEDDLQVPHPLMTQRSFVMVPLVEIEPLLVHPVTNQTMLSILQRLGADPLVKHGSRIWN